MKNKKGWYAAGAVVLALIAGAFFVVRLYLGPAATTAGWPTRCDPAGRSPISDGSI